MTVFANYGPPDGEVGGFRVVAGSGTGLSRLLLAVGRMHSTDAGPIHLHHGEEVLHIVSGRLLVRAGDERRECGPGDVVAVPAGVWHGFRALAETVLEVVAEQRIGTVFPVRHADGRVQEIEVHRTDMPWGRPPPPGASWTSDAEMRRILDAVDLEV
jgi:mannose-6-phosphate isomerase-like protein (cupin superfamily)